MGGKRERESKGEEEDCFESRTKRREGAWRGFLAKAERKEPGLAEEARGAERMRKQKKSCGGVEYSLP